MVCLGITFVVRNSPECDSSMKMRLSSNGNIEDMQVSRRSDYGQNMAGYIQQLLGNGFECKKISKSLNNWNEVKVKWQRSNYKPNIVSQGTTVDEKWTLIWKLVTDLPSYL